MLRSLSIRQRLRLTGVMRVTKAEIFCCAVNLGSARMTGLTERNAGLESFQSPNSTVPIANQASSARHRLVEQNLGISAIYTPTWWARSSSNRQRAAMLWSDTATATLADAISWTAQRRLCPRQRGMSGVNLIDETPSFTPEIYFHRRAVQAFHNFPVANAQRRNF